MSEHESPWFDDFSEKIFLEKILRSFSNFSNIKTQFVDDDGNVLMSTENEVPDCRFCQLIKESEQGLKKCKRSYARASREAAKYGEPYIFRCHAGLISWAVPIIHDQLKSSIICGQILMWEPEDYFLDEIAIMAKGLDVDIRRIKETACDLQVLSSNKVQAVSDMLFAMSLLMMQRVPADFSREREINLHQASLSAEIHKIKLAERRKQLSKREYSLDKERQLMAMIRSGKKEAADQMLDHILVCLLNRNLKQRGLIQARVLELLVMASRAAIDSGVEAKFVQNLTSRHYPELYRKDNVEEIFLWAKNMMDSLIDGVNKSKNTNNIQAVYLAVDFMERQFMDKLTIQQIADEVHLSPSYLSHIFSETFGCTLMDYLARVRINEAKTQLADISSTINEVAFRCGFTDVSYFSRVFKKLEGISPSAYKKKAVYKGGEGDE